jgi:hypothetical protein
MKLGDKQAMEDFTALVTKQNSLLRTLRVEKNQALSGQLVKFRSDARPTELEQIACAYFKIGHRAGLLRVVAFMKEQLFPISEKIYTYLFRVRDENEKQKKTFEDFFLSFPLFFHLLFQIHFSSQMAVFFLLFLLSFLGCKK